MSTAEVGVGFVRLIPSMKGFSSDAARQMNTGLTGPAQAAGRKAGDGFTTGFGNGLAAGGDRAARIGDKLTLGVTLPLVGLGAAAFSASKQFNNGMANIATLIPGNTARVNELKTGIRDLSVEVGKSTSDMSDGMFQVISAFGDSAESLDLLNINARAAAAGQATTTEAINLTSAVTKGYGDTSQEAVRKASDLALLAVRMGQTDFPQLAGSIGKVIPMAQNLGVTQEELFGSMATFTGVTGEAAEVATQMRGAMQGLQAPTADARSALEAAGFASGQAAVEQLGLAGAIGLLTDAAEETGKPLQSFLGSVEGQTFALGLAGAQAEDYERKLAAMGQAAGTTDEAFAEQTEGVNAAGFELEQAKVKAEVMAQQLGDGLAPALIDVLDAAQPVVDGIAAMAQMFAEAEPGQQKMILGAVGIVAALGPMMSIFGRVASVVGKSITGLSKFGRGTATVVKASARIGAAVGRGTVAFGRLAVAGTRAAASVARAALSMAVSAARATARVVASIATQIARWVVLGVQALLHAAKVALAWVISMGPIGLIAAGIAALVVLIIANFDTIKAVILDAFNFVRETAGAALGWIRDNWAQILVFLLGPIGAAVVGIVKNWDKIKATFSVVVAHVRAGIDEVVGFFDGLPSRVEGAISTTFNFFQAMATAAKSWIGIQINEVVAFFQRLPNRIKSAMASLANKIASPFTSAFNQIRRVWNRTVGGFGFKVPKWIPKIGGKGFKIPKMHQGGIVPGRGDVPILAEGGEGVFTPEQMKAIGTTTTSAPSAMVEISIDGNNLDRELLKWLRRAVRVEAGGNVQRALGQGTA